MESSTIADLSPFECNVCSQVLQGPVSLPCEHAFCAHCLKSYMESQKKEKKGALCPVCRSAFQQYELNEDPSMTAQLASLSYACECGLSVRLSELNAHYAACETYN